MDPKLTEVSQLFERFKAAFVRHDYDTCDGLLSQLKVLFEKSRLFVPNTCKSFNLPPFFLGRICFRLGIKDCLRFGWYEINGDNGFAESGSKLLCQRLELCDRIRVLVFIVV
jgi:hypothetical protein